MTKAGKLQDSLNPENSPELTLRRRSGTLSVSAIRELSREIPGTDSDKRETALGLLLLWHDHWSEAHKIAQAHEGEADFDLLHGIGHRREADYSNSEFWFNEAGKHPVFEMLVTCATSLLKDEEELRRQLFPNGKWNPSGFVRAVKARPDHPVLRAIQAEEMLCFYEYLTQ
ncbi:MAG TPA: hypothetical protein DCQ83_03040 [Fibrobacteres bacterium]|jgi:hypothetical protein|nr:hypothetical protein [Fibrobacterota bacterium]